MATAPKEAPAERSEGYQLEGSLLEVCSCDVLCPCWIGEDPDGGDCESVVAYHFDRGRISGVDVSGLTLVGVVLIPGNVLEGNWRQLLFVDDRATRRAGRAMVDAFTGKLGGPLADLAELVGERVAIERAPIEHEIVDGAGTLKVGRPITRDAPVHAVPTAARRRSTTRSSRRSRARRRTSRVADHQKIDMPQYGYQWDRTRRKNAIQSDWKMDFAGERRRVPRALAAASAAGPPAAVVVLRRSPSRGRSRSRRQARRGGAAAPRRADRDGPAARRSALVLFLVAWQVMVAAMMLPSSLPLVRLFARAVRGAAAPARGDGGLPRRLRAGVDGVRRARVRGRPGRARGGRRERLAGRAQWLIGGARAGAGGRLPVLARSRTPAWAAAAIPARS